MITVTDRAGRHHTINPMAIVIVSQPHQADLFNGVRCIIRLDDGTEIRAIQSFEWVSSEMQKSNQKGE